jgi:hypothetical protein
MISSILRCLFDARACGCVLIVLALEEETDRVRVAFYPTGPSFVRSHKYGDTACIAFSKSTCHLLL